MTYLQVGVLHAESSDRNVSEGGAILLSRDSTSSLTTERKKLNQPIMEAALLPNGGHGGHGGHGGTSWTFYDHRIWIGVLS